MWQTTLNTTGEVESLMSDNDAATSVVKNGSCRVYDNTTMSQSVMAVLMGWKSMATIFMSVALYFSQKSDIVMKNEVKDISNQNVDHIKDKPTNDVKLANA